MEWKDEGIILHTHALGENKSILSLFTPTQGRWMGVVRTSAKTKPWLQCGAKVDARWHARLEAQMGSWTLEPLSSYTTPILDAPGPLMAFLSAAALCHKALPERHAYSRLYEHFENFCKALPSLHWMQAYLLFELTLLEELGYGLDLQQCAVTGVTKDLVAVSPKTGRAVCAEVAKPYEGRLLPLPSFLRTDNPPSPQEVREALILTGFFLEHHLLGRTLPAPRLRLSDTF